MFQPLKVYCIYTVNFRNFPFQNIPLYEGPVYVFFLVQTRCHRLHKALDDFIKFEAVTLQHLDHDGDHNTTLGTSVLEWQEACSRSSSPVRSQSSDLHLNKQTGICKLTLLHSERPKLCTILAFLNEIGLRNISAPFTTYSTKTF